jgi:hypothetical protein
MRNELGLLEAHMFRYAWRNQRPIVQFSARVSIFRTKAHNILSPPTFLILTPFFSFSDPNKLYLVSFPKCGYLSHSNCLLATANPSIT